jgi:hypothetical protein
VNFQATDSDSKCIGPHEQSTRSYQCRISDFFDRFYSRFLQVGLVKDLIPAFLFFVPSTGRPESDGECSYDHKPRDEVEQEVILQGVDSVGVHGGLAGLA